MLYRIVPDARESCSFTDWPLVPLIQVVRERMQTMSIQKVNRPAYCIMHCKNSFQQSTRSCPRAVWTV